MRTTDCLRQELQILQLANLGIEKIKDAGCGTYERNMVSLQKNRDVIHAEIRMLLNMDGWSHDCLYPKHGGCCRGMRCPCGCDKDSPQCTND
jgi:hypothetical protein